MPDPATPVPATLNFTKLKAKLRELFELDKADLDFGIYRVLRQRHTEIAEFLDKHLETTVRNALSNHGDLQAVQIRHDLEKAESAAQAAGISAEQSPRVMELRTRLDKRSDLEATADEVYSHLLTFFSRYYQGGDFLGLHRSTVHGHERYMIPYNGEEVKLVWANMDQYYIKSSELLRDYNFKVATNLGEIFRAAPEDVFTVRFKLVEGDTEKDNRKADSKTTRAFGLDAETPFVETDEKTLTIHFRYSEHPSERGLQDKLSAETERALADGLPPKWKKLLFAADPSHQPKTEKERRTIFQKHLRGYTAKHQFDYFIHKDLGGFLRRELDFYVKNEVMHLDDIEDSSAPKAEEYLSKIRAIRRCALPIIGMVAQLEEFQKKLWLKKKFVVETRYCLTLDRVPESLYLDICQCDAQWLEWEDLVAISETATSSAPKGRTMPAHGNALGELGENAQALKGRTKSAAVTDSPAPSGLGDSGDATSPGRCPGLVSDAALRLQILKANPHLMVDTKHFDGAFTLKLLGSIDDLDESLDGVCFHSENFQALQLMQARYREQVKCVYIDPPYNTGNDGFAYKDNFWHSSWASMIADRLVLSRELLDSKGSCFSQIDDYEEHNLRHILDMIYTPQRRINRITWVRTFNSGSSKGLSNKLPANLDTIFWYANTSNYRHDKILREYSAGAMKRYDKVETDGRRFKWNPMKTYSRDKLDRLMACGEAMITEGSKYPVYKKYLNEESGAPLDNNWHDIAPIGTFASEREGFETQKPVKLIERCISLTGSNVTLDFFGGSGTTGHAVINLNRSNGGRRKYLLVELGEHFNTVLVQRLKKVVYSTDWKDGKPQSRNTGISHAFKIVRLESYEDTLNNLRLARTAEQKAALTKATDEQRDAYLLGYFLDVESEGSASLLDVARFRDPFGYKLDIATSSAGETKETNVDLMETFNWLLGLKVKHIDHQRGFLSVTGERRAGGRCLILWRSLGDDEKADNTALVKYLEKITVTPADTEYDFIYVNGPHTLTDPHNKVHLIEETFHRLMFDTTNFESLS